MHRRGGKGKGGQGLRIKCDDAAKREVDDLLPQAAEPVHRAPLQGLGEEEAAHLVDRDAAPLARPKVQASRAAGGIDELERCTRPADGGVQANPLLAQSAPETLRVEEQVVAAEGSLQEKLLQVGRREARVQA